MCHIALKTTVLHTITLETRSETVSVVNFATGGAFVHPVRQ